MEVGEMVAVTFVADEKFECPFDHELEDPPTVENNIVGKGATLASNRKKGESTILYGPNKPSEKLDSETLPQKDKNHIFYDKGRCVTIEFDDDTSMDYPVSCSAHHLIPSQESLKDHSILDYMCKEGSSGAHNHSYSDGAVWSDVGYDTNGSENGSYLPGSYAVGGGRGGLVVWYPFTEDKDDEHDVGYLEVDKLPPAEYEDFILYGKDRDISDDNPCWLYVEQAMDKAPGQFHDRHVKYSQLVEKGLSAIYEQYKSFDVTLGEKSCDKCNDRIKKIEEKGLPAPYGLPVRLNGMSRKLSGYLSTKKHGWADNVFTSRWCQEYMKSRAKKRGAIKRDIEI